MGVLSCHRLTGDRPSIIAPGRVVPFDANSSATQVSCWRFPPSLLTSLSAGRSPRQVSLPDQAEFPHASMRWRALSIELVIRMVQIWKSLKTNGKSYVMIKEKARLGYHHLQDPEADHQTGTGKILSVQIADSHINCYTKRKMSPSKRPYCKQNLL